MNNAFWEWCVYSTESAYGANNHFDGPSSMDSGPCWCFQRMGQTTTVLPDGRVVYIAGEHEDYYDPDFYIYNDVVVKNPDGTLDIFGYPENVFLPTDFHSATLVGPNIILIGNLGYPDDRVSDQTQIFTLDTQSWEISAVQSHAENPGWIHKHKVSLSGDQTRIVITGGIIEGRPLLENIDDWELKLEDWSWRKLTDRNWTRWLLQRTDGQPNQLWKMRTALWDQQTLGWLKKHIQETASGFPQDLIAEIVPSDNALSDPGLLKSLYHPPVSTKPAVEDEDEYGSYRLQIEGVTVRYKETMQHIIVTIEGHLPDTCVEKITSDLKSKLTALEKHEYSVEEC